MALSDHEISELSRISGRDLSELSGLLVEVVANLGSVGFMPPLSEKDAEHFWKSVGMRLGDERAPHLLLVARKAGKIAGSVQLIKVPAMNAPHRGEIAKLLVHPEMRHQGVASALLEQVEQKAISWGLTLLHMDTRPGDPSESLYLKCGFEIAGDIPDYFMRPEDGKLEATRIMFKRLSKREMLHRGDIG